MPQKLRLVSKSLSERQPVKLQRSNCTSLPSYGFQNELKIEVAQGGGTELQFVQECPQKSQSECQDFHQAAGH